jgi:hypothetical protein
MRALPSRARAQAQIQQWSRRGSKGDKKDREIVHDKGKVGTHSGCVERQPSRVPVRVRGIRASSNQKTNQISNIKYQDQNIKYQISNIKTKI